MEKVKTNLSKYKKKLDKNIKNNKLLQSFVKSLRIFRREIMINKKKIVFWKARKVLKN